MAWTATSEDRSPSRHQGGSRLVALEGCFNFRDLGGYRTCDGRTLRWQRLYRADGLHRLTVADLHHLSQLGLATVIDLRSAQEVEHSGRIRWPEPGLAYHHVPMFDVLPERDTLPAWDDPAVVAVRYIEMMDGASGAFAEALTVLSRPDCYPAVFHCAAGKDRTGLLAAVVLGLLGVSDEQIVADYALSRDAMIRMLRWLRDTHPDAREEIDASAAAIVAAEPETMRLFLSGFMERYGSFTGLAQSLGVGATVAPLRRALLG